jgi:hypothetical protein
MEPNRLMRSGLLAAVFLAAATLSGCNESTSPGSRLVVISGDNQSAPVGTTLPDPVVVQVLNTRGNAQANTTVEFWSMAGPTLWLIPVSLPDLNRAFPITDSDGMVSVPVRFGSVEGEAWLGVRVASLGLRDSIPFTILPED